MAEKKRTLDGTSSEEISAMPRHLTRGVDSIRYLREILPRGAIKVLKEELVREWGLPEDFNIPSTKTPYLYPDGTSFKKILLKYGPRDGMLKHWGENGWTYTSFAALEMPTKRARQALTIINGAAIAADCAEKSSNARDVAVHLLVAMGCISALNLAPTLEELKSWEERHSNWSKKGTDNNTKNAKARMEELFFRLRSKTSQGMSFKKAKEELRAELIKKEQEKDEKNKKKLIKRVTEINELMSTGKAKTSQEAEKIAKKRHEDRIIKRVKEQIKKLENIPRQKA